MRTAALTAVWRRTRSGAGAPWRQAWGSPPASQVQTVMERVLVLLRDGPLPSATTTGSRWSRWSRCRKPPRRVRMEAVLSGGGSSVSAGVLVRLMVDRLTLVVSESEAEVPGSL